MNTTDVPIKRHCFACDLKEDENLIRQYIEYHRKVWPGIIESIRESGIRDMEIFLTGNRLFMIIEVDHTFDFDQKATDDASNSEVRKWEALMWQFQKAVPWAKKGEKWVRMDRIFKLP